MEVPFTEVEQSAIDSIVASENATLETPITAAEWVRRELLKIVTVRIRVTVVKGAQDMTLEQLAETKSQIDAIKVRK